MTKSQRKHPHKKSGSLNKKLENEFMSQIINHLPLAMFCKDYSEGKGEIVAWNDFAESLFGLTKKEAIGKTDYDFFPKEQCDYFKQKDLDTIRSNQMVFIQEEKVDSPKLGQRLVRTWKVPIKGRYLLGISQDQTMHKELELELEKQKALAFQSAKLASLGEVAGGIAHEINNPLAIIAGYSDMMSRMAQKGHIDKNEVIRLTDSIQKTIQRLKLIVDGLRKFSRDGSKEDFKDVLLDQVVHDAVSFCEERLKRVGIRIILESQTNARSMISCRDIQIGQVLINLLNNSCSAVRTQSDPWVSISINQTHAHYLIAVTDSGPGIPVDVQAKLFQPFFTTKDVGEGTGLGLSISKGIVEQHGGRLYLDTSCSNTRFVIELPMPKPNQRVA